MAHANRSVPAIYNLLKDVTETSDYLYMFIDAAHDSRIYPALCASIHTRCCLFSEEHISEKIKSVSPFLVKIKRLDDFVSWCIREGAHRNWMVFFASNQVHVSELRLHFKRYSFAKTPEGKRYFFRYYDARVLPTFIASSADRERQEFFRPCRAFWIPQLTSQNTVQLLQLEANGRQTVLQDSGEILLNARVAVA